MTRILIYGRTNVGKSTLFNLIVGEKKAIVHDQKGVTRDFLVREIKRFDTPFTLIDTPGFFDDIYVSEHKDFQESMQRNLEKEIKNADLILFVIDGKVGCTPLDERLAQKLRTYQKETLVLVNKCESEKTSFQDAFRLGFNTVMPISALHTNGLRELVDYIIAQIKKTKSDIENTENTSKNSDIKIALLGRPNVGKSTLVNQLIGHDAQLVADQAGVTRDCVAYSWTYHDRNYEIIDTPGIRRSLNKADEIEKKAIDLALEAINFAHIVVLIVDATQDVSQGIDRQELSLARTIIDEGRAIVVALNKSDLVENSEKIRKEWQLYFEEHLAQIKGMSFVNISAINNRGIDNMMRVIDERYTAWQTRVPTSRLNDWLAYCREKVPPPLVRGRRIKLKYIAQIRTRPPSFRIISNFAKDVPENYRRFLVNQLMKDFNLLGVPIRLHFKEGTKNPYAKSKNG